MAKNNNLTCPTGPNLSDETRQVSSCDVVLPHNYAYTTSAFGKEPVKNGFTC